MYRIAHFSDFHLVSPSVWDYQRTMMLIADAIDEENVDHIVITGDIVESQNTGTIEAFVGKLRAWGWSSSSKLSIVPGNHDIFPYNFVKSRKPWTLMRPQTAFKKYCGITRCCRVGKNSSQLFRGDAFPYGKELTSKVVLAGMDTTANDKRNPFYCARGEMSEEDRDAVSSFFHSHPRAVHRVVLMHHYPDKVRPNLAFINPKYRAVQTWLSEMGASLVLCGHIHEGLGDKERDFRIGPSRTRVLCNGDSGYNWQYALINLHDSGRVTVSYKEYSEDELDDMLEQNDPDKEG